MIRWLHLLGVLCALCVTFASTKVAAESGVELRAADASSGSKVIELAQTSGDLVGHFTVENTSGETLKITELSLRRGGELGGFAPRELTVQFEDGTRVATLEPGATKPAVVRWVKPRPPRFERGYSHVMVTTDRHTTPAVLGVAYRAPDANDTLLRWVPVLLVLLPLLGALGISLLGRRSADPGHSIRAVAAVSSGGALALSLYAALNFDPALTRFDGSEGFFVLYRRVLGAGLEVGFGLDGISLSFAILLPLVSLLAVGLGGERQRPEVWASLLSIQAGLALMVVGLDVLSVACGTLLFGATLAVACQRAGGRRGAGFVGAATLAAVVALLLLPVGAPGHLMDGALTSYPTSLLELSRVLPVTPGAVLGLHKAQLIWPLLVFAAVVFLGAPGVGSWCGVLARAKGSAFALVATAGAGAVVGYLLLRVGYLVFPAAITWSASGLAATGGIVALWSALSALQRRSWVSTVLDVVGVSGGLALVALATSNAIGVMACVVLLVGRGLGLAATLGVASALERRLGVDAAAQVTGLGKEHPVLAIVAAVGALGLAGLPGGVVFLGVAQAVLAALPMLPWASLLVVSAVAIAAVAVARAWLALVRGHFAEELRQSSRLAPFGGRLSPVRGTELLALSAALLLGVVLGVAPRAWLMRVEGAALDHASRVNPPGPLEIAAAPSPSNPAV